MPQRADFTFECSQSPGDRETGPAGPFFSIDRPANPLDRARPHPKSAAASTSRGCPQSQRCYEAAFVRFIASFLSSCGWIGASASTRCARRSGIRFRRTPAHRGRDHETRVLIHFAGYSGGCSAWYSGAWLNLEYSVKRPDFLARKGFGRDIC
jgi:hypothetical protein